MNTLLKACWRTGEEQEKLKKEALEALQFLENEIKGKKYFGGDEIGVVDHAGNFIAYWYPIISYGVELITDEKFPNLCRWAHQYCNDSFVKENLPPMDEIVAKLKRG